MTLFSLRTPPDYIALKQLKDIHNMSHVMSKMPPKMVHFICMLCKPSCKASLEPLTRRHRLSMHVASVHNAAASVKMTGRQSLCRSTGETTHNDLPYAKNQQSQPMFRV